MNLERCNLRKQMWWIIAVHTRNGLQATIDSTLTTIEHLAHPKWNGELFVEHRRYIVVQPACFSAALWCDSAIIKIETLQIVHIKRHFAINIFLQNRIAVVKHVIWIAVIRFEVLKYGFLKFAAKNVFKGCGGGLNFIGLCRLQRAWYPNIIVQPL